MIFVYDCIRDPILVQHKDDGFNEDITNLFSIIEILAVPIIIVVIATAVHIQQK